jgi:arginyl-tRNA--protein-N-Asp/Glu arginylyltransferase
MSFLDKEVLEKIQFYVTAKYSCGYINKREAQSIVATPYKRIDKNNYGHLIKRGFRRSGQYVYKPDCKGCKACVPIRLHVNNFSISKSQKRVKRSLKNLTVKIIPQNQPDENIGDYNDFLIKSNVDSKLIEFRDNGELKLVTIIDVLDDGISAVYTFFNGDDLKKSYGTYSILWLLDWCKKRNEEYIYLGYWIGESQKMKYKTNFKPYELLIDGSWQGT